MAEILDLERAKNTIGSAQGIVFYLDFGQMTAADNMLVVTVQMRKDFLNTEGVVQGGILYTICDQAMAVYALSTGRGGVGTEGSIRHYRPALGEDVLKAVVTCRKSGKTTSHYLVELYNQDDKLIADAMFSAFHRMVENQHKPVTE